MTSKHTYKDTLKEVLKMRSKASLSVYDRGKLLLSVFDDRDFRADLGNVDDFHAADVLDKYLDDLPYMFLDLRSMIEKFPARDDWSKKTLRDIYEETMKTDDAEDKPKRQQNRATKKEVEELTNTIKAQASRLNFTEQLLNERTKTCEELIAENKELRRQIAVAEGRIQELERRLLPSVA